MTEIIPNEKLFEWYIRITDLQDNFVGDFDSVSDAIIKLDIKNPSIGNINSTIAGKRKYAYGYKWYRLSRPFKLLEGEVFRYCVNLNNLYGVSNYGRVISLQFHGKDGCKLLAQNSIKIGYKVVKIRIWKDKYVYSKPVHQLVAEAFIPNPDNKKAVDHIDTNPSNNNVTNLRWVTPFENQHNPITLKRIRNSMVVYNKSDKHKKVNSLKHSKATLMYDLNNNFIKEFKSATEAAKEINGNIAGIALASRTNSKYKKYIFRYKDGQISNTEANKGSDKSS